MLEISRISRSFACESCESSFRIGEELGKKINAEYRKSMDSSRASCWNTFVAKFYLALSNGFV